MDTNTWRIDYDNDSDEDCYWEEWKVTNGVRSFVCRNEWDAEWLLATLAGITETKKP